MSTAEPWHLWVRYPEFANHVNYLAGRTLPYWEGIEVEAAVEYVIDMMKLLEKTFPGKEIVIGEVGWPSEGRTRESAVATTSNHRSRRLAAGREALPTTRQEVPVLPCRAPRRVQSRRAQFRASAHRFACRGRRRDRRRLGRRPALAEGPGACVRSERTGVVQAPQDYRDAGVNATRNERNAIIQHGTMTLVRRSLLEWIGWAEWCITEDAELGLRIFEQGYEATYIPASYDRGVMPDNFLDFKKQRARWAFGAMQILRHHFDLLVRGRGMSNRRS